MVVLLTGEVVPSMGPEPFYGLFGSWLGSALINGGFGRGPIFILGLGFSGGCDTSLTGVGIRVSFTRGGWGSAMVVTPSRAGSGLGYLSPVEGRVLRWL